MIVSGDRFHFVHNTVFGFTVVCHLRRAACLLHGFYRGGCSPKGVWEAISLPGRAQVVVRVHTAICDRYVIVSVPFFFCSP
jgi:hypothetical protein